VRALFAIEAADQSAARQIGNKVLRQMDVVLAGPPTARQSREQVWTIMAELDLSALPEIEPDNAHTRVSYVTRNLGSVTWRVNSSDDRREIHEWPPGFWAQHPEDDQLLAHPAVRAVLIHASAVSDDPS
jgi:hypothetical protein